MTQFAVSHGVDVETSPSPAWGTALRIADDLCDPRTVAEAAAGTRIERDAASRGLEGASGMALLYAAVVQFRDAPRYRTAMHEYLREAAQARSSTASGLFTGLAGLLAACTYAMKVEPRYAGLAAKCRAELVRLYESVESFAPATVMFDYDVIAGHAGVAIALASSESPELARLPCDYLVWMLEDADRWNCAHPRRPEDGKRHDLGMAHGAAGILSALCLAAPREARYDAAIRAIAEFLRAHRYEGEQLRWPASVGESGPHPTHSAWCYGVPGCAAALHLAAERLGDESYQALALAALRQLCEGDVESWRLQDHALCHGLAGTALVIDRVGAAARDAALRARASTVLDDVARAYAPEFRFGYRTGVDDLDCGYALTGSAGIALALLTAADVCDPGWCAFFGLP